MTREITHLKAFMAALDSMGKNPLEIGLIPPTPGVVEMFFNDSTGKGDNGEKDERGPWNTKGVRFIEAPMKIEASVTADEVTREIEKAVRKSSSRPKANRSRK